VNVSAKAGLELDLFSCYTVGLILLNLYDLNYAGLCSFKICYLRSDPHCLQPERPTRLQRYNNFIRNTCCESCK
jgi:hypothetical protein